MITAQQESFRECALELSALFPRHWEELALFKDRMPLSPQWDEYYQREDAGRLMLTTVREDGDIAAYYTANIQPGFHYGETLTGTMDLCWVVPERRQRGLALPLFRHTERELKRRGVQAWYSGAKVHNPLGMPRLHEALGFIPADLYYARWLGT